MHEIYEANQGPNPLPNGSWGSATRNVKDFSGASNAFDSVRIHDGTTSVSFERQRQGRRIMGVVKQYPWSCSWMIFCVLLALINKLVAL
jgi:hypothetical protein